MAEWFKKTSLHHRVHGRMVSETLATKEFMAEWSQKTFWIKEF
jgi:hypothetical protein